MVKLTIMEFHKVKTGKKRFEKKSKPSTYKSFRNSRDYQKPRYSQNDKRESTIVVCDDCGIECKIPFVPKSDKPVYCEDCFRKNKSRYPENERSTRYEKSNRPSREYKEESTIVECDDCGIEFDLPFLPKFDKPVYCRECFRKNHSQYLDNDRFSKNDKGQSRTKEFKSKSQEKFLKKQESLFSGGSEKFYNSLKEKLFEILGGKICSRCGFSDERVLGFKNIYDEESFDNIRRGGFASSWGKYISDPRLAREELQILCLNCNELSKSKHSSRKINQNLKKKKKRFPR